MIYINAVRVEFKRTHHANHKIGMTMTWPDGTKKYGEYTNHDEAIAAAEAETKKGKT